MGGLYRDGGVAVMARAFSDGLAGAGENKLMPGLHDVETNAARAKNDHACLTSWITRDTTWIKGSLL